MLCSKVLLLLLLKRIQICFSTFIISYRMLHRFISSNWFNFKALLLRSYKTVRPQIWYNWFS